ncbi:MAG: SDR family NAD(P)-dependent oxidoreductase [Parvibaculum sp.]|nr:SDR family NAD(P)-dependent oxidoreductase [Parvibaculum sp.]
MRKTVWITGAGKGIGRALALHMAREGWSVAASARTVEDLTSLAVEGEAGRIHVFALDVTDLDATQKTIVKIEGELGPIDMAILNAGTHVAMSAENFSVATFRKLVDVNLMGPVNGLGVLLPLFRVRGRGHIAVVASVAGYRGLPTSSAYGATKAALINMCEALKPELVRDGIDLSLINPGFVETPLTEKNKFPMPFLISAEEAATTIYKGLINKKFEISFPWTFVLLLKLMRLLPYRLFFFLTSRMVTP